MARREVPRTTDDEAALTAEVTALASQYGRYGYRRSTALLRAEGWRCNHKRLERPVAPTLAVPKPARAAPSNTA